MKNLKRLLLGACITSVLFLSSCTGKSQLIPLYVLSGGGRDSHLEECNRAHPVQAYMRICPTYPRNGNAPITPKNANDKVGEVCLLELSIRYNDLEVFGLLLGNGAEPTRCSQGYENRFYESWITRYCEDRPKHKVLRVLNSIESAGIIPTNPSSVLIVASNYACPEGVSLAIRHGADLNFVGPIGLRPLHYAARRTTDYSFEVLKILIDAGADTSLLSGNGESPLTMGRRLSHPSNKNWLKFEEALKKAQVRNDTSR